jgi:NAD(P)-dependent dehydrogenase (short-subunit alcohol dehydrogenase family)
MDRGATADRGAVMVTGATGGIGSAIAARLARTGVPVSILDLERAPIESLVNSLNAARSGSAVGCTGDASRRGDVEAWLQVTVNAFGPIGGLVNVAGLFMSKPVLDLQDQDVHEALAANLMTTIVCSQVVGRHMVQAQHGSIVNIASTAGEYGSISPAAHYAAAKGGVIAFTKSVAREFAPFGIRVNAVSPGPIDTTGRSFGSWEPDDKVAGRSLLQRMGRPDEVAEAVCFLLSEESSFITGHTLRVNGGALL